MKVENWLYGAYILIKEVGNTIINVNCIKRYVCSEFVNVLKNLY